MTPADELRHAAAQWERLLAAMEGDCPSCGGSGRIVNNAWHVWYNRSNELVRVAQVARQAAGLPPDRRVTITTDTSGFPRIDPSIAPQIEAPAVVVAAERAIDEHQNARPHEPEQMLCPNCEGQGRALTVIGAQVADLLTRHGFLRRPMTGPQPGHQAGGYGTGGFSSDGYQNDGYQNDGYGQSGHDTGGYDQRGYDQGGYDNRTYDTGGYDQGGYEQGGQGGQGGYNPGNRGPGAYDGGPYREPY